MGVRLGIYFAIIGALFGQTRPTYKTLPGEHGREAVRYLVETPKEYESSGKEWPVILYLHGTGDRGHDLSLVERAGVAHEAEKTAHFPFIVVAPQLPPDIDIWCDSDAVLAVLDQVLAEYRTDRSRVHLTGVSAGGWGAWHMAYLHPERFAAVMPLAGWNETDWAARLSVLPVWAFHGQKDDVIPPERSSSMIEALQKFGGTARLSLLINVDHDIGKFVWSRPEVYSWLLQFRNTNPLTAAPRRVIELDGGEWFDGQRFVARTMYVRNGLLVEDRPKQVDEVRQLHGGYVVAPFADAHNHLPDSQRTWAVSNRADLASGIFYVLNPNDVALLSNPLRRLAGPSTIDEVFAHAGFSVTGGHPEDSYRDLLKQGKLPGVTADTVNGNAYYSVRTKKDLDRWWPVFLKTRPEFVKIYLLNSEEYRLDEQKAARENHGLSPEMAGEVVKRAHALGLRVGAHVESAEDLRNAANAGVDYLMHMPGFGGIDIKHSHRILESDAALLQKNGVGVVATSWLGGEQPGAAQDLQRSNLRVLKEAGVEVLIGSDGMAGDAVKEMRHLRQLGVFTDAELLRMWSIDTPRMIFPHRNIGALQSGFEASFLVLDGDPLKDFGNMQRIRMRWKMGEELGGE